MPFFKRQNVHQNVTSFLWKYKFTKALPFIIISNILNIWAKSQRFPRHSNSHTRTKSWVLWEKLIPITTTLQCELSRASMTKKYCWSSASLLLQILKRKKIEGRNVESVASSDNVNFTGCNWSPQFIQLFRKR